MTCTRTRAGAHDRCVYGSSLVCRRSGDSLRLCVCKLGEEAYAVLHLSKWHRLSGPCQIRKAPQKPATTQRTVGSESLIPRQARPGPCRAHRHGPSRSVRLCIGAIIIGGLLEKQMGFPGKWDKPHLNQGPLLFKQTNQEGHL